MKNLFLPFVVVALFAIGSCGDDASINPPVDGKDTTKEQDTTIVKDTVIKKDSAEVKVNIAFQLYGYPFIFNYRPIDPKDTIAFELNISERFERSGNILMRDEPLKFLKTTIILDSVSNLITHFSYSYYASSGGGGKYSSYYRSETRFVVENIPFMKNHQILNVSLDSTNTHMLVKEALISSFSDEGGGYGSNTRARKYDSLLSTSRLEMEIKLP